MASFTVRNQLHKGWLPTALFSILLSDFSAAAFQTQQQSQTIAVFGGSGFVGRRVCEQLSQQENVSVISISRSGRPPQYYWDYDWADQVEWIESDVMDEVPKLPPLSAAISLVGNVEPVPEWQGFWGLGFDDNKLIMDWPAKTFAVYLKRLGRRDLFLCLLATKLPEQSIWGTNWRIFGWEAADWILCLL